MRGFALITVLWMVSLLTLIATSALMISRSQARMSLRSAQIVSAAAIADGAIRLTLVQIYTPPPAGTLLGFSADSQLRLFERQVRVHVEREAGRVDLNASDPALLMSVFIAGGIEASQARSFASRVIDWRDVDQQAAVEGAEFADYQRAGVDHAPRDGPFESVGELQQLLGMAELSREILDAFTVYSTRSPTISYRLAHPLVQRALDAQPRSAEPASEPTDATPEPQRLPVQAVRVRACMQQPVAICRVAIARLAAGRQYGFTIHAWYTEAAA